MAIKFVNGLTGATATVTALEDYLWYEASDVWDLSTPDLTKPT